MSDFIIQERPSEGVDFYFDFQFDSTLAEFPFEYSGIKLFVNNDMNPLAELRVKGRKVWNERVDLGKYYSAGTYKLRVESQIWLSGGSGCTAIIRLKLADFEEYRVHTPPVSAPPFPFPVQEPMLSSLTQYSRQQAGRSSRFERFVDEWQVDYPG